MIKIEEWENLYYISIDNISEDDEDIAKYLNLPLKKYRNIMKKYGAKRFRYTDSYFDNKEDIQKFINSEELTKYLIMAKLTGD